MRPNQVKRAPDGTINEKDQVMGPAARVHIHCYDVFGDNRTSFRELECKIPLFHGMEVR
jgi:hypothetical protein